MNPELYNDDCMKILGALKSNCVDLVLCDLPYQVTNCRWDKTPDLDSLWLEYKRIVRSTGNILLFSSGNFTIDLILSNRKDFRYRLIWKKNRPTGMSSAKYRPMKYFEEICVFSHSGSTYNPIMKPRVGKGKDCYKYNHYCGSNNHIHLDKINIRYDPEFVQPSDVLEFNTVPNRTSKLHPTQKPVDLCEYLIKSYSNVGDVVLDNCMGSGTTGVACAYTKRNFIGIEKDKKYYDIAYKRVVDAYNTQNA